MFFYRILHKYFNVKADLEGLDFRKLTPDNKPPLADWTL